MGIQIGEEHIDIGFLLVESVCIPVAVDLYGDVAGSFREAELSQRLF